MTLTSYLLGLASDYTVHMILTDYLAGVAYYYTVHHFECYNSLSIPLNAGDVIKPLI